jgi:hypothetical protein
MHQCTSGAFVPSRVRFRSRTQKTMTLADVLHDRLLRKDAIPTVNATTGPSDEERMARTEKEAVAILASVNRDGLRGTVGVVGQSLAAPINRWD